MGGVSNRSTQCVDPFDTVCRLVRHVLSSELVVMDVSGLLSGWRERYVPTSRELT
jgi:hypothetical protein